MKLMINLCLIFIAFSQSSKIGISGATIISSNEYQSGFFTQGLYFQRSSGIVDYGFNINYTTYIKTDTNNTYNKKECFPEFILFAKLQIPITKDTSFGPVIGLGAYQFLEIFLERH